MNPHPMYRRRRRIVATIVATVAFSTLWLTGPDGTDGNDPCDLTPHTPTCEMETP